MAFALTKTGQDRAILPQQPHFEITQVSVKDQVAKGMVNRRDTFWRKKIGDLLFADQLVPCIPQPAEFSLIHADEDAILVQGVEAARRNIIEVFFFVERSGPGT
jgi:hypothetical protein